MKLSFFRIALLLVVGVGLSLTACQNKAGGSGSDSLKMVPANASSVTAINLPSILEKMDYENFKTTPKFQKRVEEIRENDPLFAAFVENPDAAGIDINQNMYFAVSFDEETGMEEFITFTFSLKDAGKFETTVKEALKDGVQVGDGFKYVKPHSDNILGWNESTAIVGFTSSYTDMQKRLAGQFNKTEDKSIADNPDLQKAFKGEHDVKLWMSSNTFSDNPQAGMAMAMAEIDPAALKDNYVHGYMDFLDGEIKGVADLFVNKTLAKDLDKFFKDETNGNYSKYIPGENLSFLMMNALDIRGIHEVLSARPQSKNFLEFALKKYGITIDDISSTFGGDVVVAGFETAERDNPKGLFITDVKDREKLNTFLNLAIEQGLLELEGNDTYKIVALRYSGANTSFEVNFEDGLARMAVADDKIFVTGDQELLNKAKSGGFSGGQQVDKDVMKLFNNNLFATYFAVPPGLDEFGPDVENLEVEKVTMEANRKQVLFDMLLKDKSTNALKQLMEAEDKEGSYEQPEAM